MGQARTNARRRRQAANKFSHLAKRQRPHYRMYDAATSAARLSRLIAAERTRANNKSKSK